MTDTEANLAAEFWTVCPGCFGCWPEDKDQIEMAPVHRNACQGSGKRYWFRAECDACNGRGYWTGQGFMPSQFGVICENDSDYPCHLRGTTHRYCQIDCKECHGDGFTPYCGPNTAFEAAEARGWDIVLDTGMEITEVHKKAADWRGRKPLARVEEKQGHAAVLAALLLAHEKDSTTR